MYIQYLFKKHSTRYLHCCRALLLRCCVILRHHVCLKFCGKRRCQASAAITSVDLKRVEYIPVEFVFAILTFHYQQRLFSNPFARRIFNSLEATPRNWSTSIFQSRIWWSRSGRFSIAFAWNRLQLFLVMPSCRAWLPAYSESNNGLFVWFHLCNIEAFCFFYLHN